MATKHKDTATGKDTKRGASPMFRDPKLRPSFPPGTSVAKDNGKTRPLAKSSSMAGEVCKNVPNYLKPTVRSKTDVGKKLHSHEGTQKTNPTLLRRRSFDKPLHVPSSQRHKSIPSSSARGDHTAACPMPHKNSAAAVTRPVAPSERVAKVVRAVRSQPPLVKTKSLPKPKPSSRKEGVIVKTNGSKKATQELTHATNIVETEAEEESLDGNVEEELSKLESQSPGGRDDPITPQKHVENADEENHSPRKHVNNGENQEKLGSKDLEEHHQEDEQEQELVHEHTPEPAAENVEVGSEEAQVASEGDPAEEKDEIKPHVSVTVKNTQDDLGGVDDQGIHTSNKADENMVHHKAGEEEEEKQAASGKSESEISGVVHKRHVEPRNKKESPAYNDVIEETASKLAEKRVNKVRALAGAFETVISLEQPHSS